MPFGSLVNVLAQGAKAAGSGIARGAKGATGRVGRLLDAEQSPAKPPAAMTPGFNPDTPLPISNTAVPSMLVNPSPDVDLPRANLGNLVPKYDSIAGATIKSAPPPRLNEAEASLMKPPGNVPAGPAMPAPRREDVGIPQLPGREGPPRPYDPITAAKYDYVMASPKAEGASGRLKSGLKPAVLGFLQAAAQNKENPLAAGLGGAAAGLAGGAIDPTAGREFEFDVLRKPELEAQMKRQQAEEVLRSSREKQSADIEGTRAETDLRRAQADAARAGIKDADLTKRKQEAEIALIGARTEAIQTGKPVQKDIEVNGQIRTFNVYPDGSMTELGGSAAAATNAANIKSREKVAGMQEAGRNARASQSQAGQDRRAAGKKAIKTVTSEDIDEAMKDPANKGLKRDQVIKVFQKSGYITPKY